MYNVSMKSGLEGRNNRPDPGRHGAALDVSMKSDLEGRNNRTAPSATRWACTSLNEVRPRRPEQSRLDWEPCTGQEVSMKSGLEGRNNRRLDYLASAGAGVSMKSGLEGRNNLRKNQTSPPRAERSQ